MTHRGSRVVSLVRAIWIMGFLVGTTTHVVDLIVGGADAYGGFPVPVRLFWISLTVIDPAIVILLLLRRRVGVALGVAVILVDIAVNWTMFIMFDGLSAWGTISQTLFAVFLIATSRMLWRAGGHRRL